MHVKGHWRIRVKGKTGRKGTQHNKGRAAVQKRTRVEEKRVWARESERGRDCGKSKDCIFRN